MIEKIVPAGLASDSSELMTLLCFGLLTVVHLASGDERSPAASTTISSGSSECLEATVNADAR